MALISAHDALLAEIENEITGIASGDTYRINDCREQILFDAVLIISQYCASKDNYKDVSVGNLEAVVHENADRLFDYTLEITDHEDSETGEPYRHYEYTISYKGDSYFPDYVFHLGDEQKARSEDYALNLNLFLNDGSHKAQGSTHSNISEAVLNYPYTPSGNWGSPFPGDSWKLHISPQYGNREDPINHKTDFHTGVDIAYASLSRPRLQSNRIRAWQDGTLNNRNKGRHLPPLVLGSTITQDAA